MADKTILLDAPFEMFGKTVSEVILREPTGGDLFDLGEPTQVARAPDGTLYVVEFGSVIKQYAARLLRHDGGENALKLMSLQDGKKLKSAILGFFTDADQAIMEKSSTH